MNRQSGIDTEKGNSCSHIAFSWAFIDAKAAQWGAFRKRLSDDHVPEEFATVVNAVEDFLAPVAHAIQTHTAMQLHWEAPGPWAAPH